MLDGYQKFLASKAARVPMRGLTKVPALADHLFPFQRMSVEFGLRAGSTGLFLDTGLGKTECQLEWCQKAIEETNRPALVLTPLAVAGQTKRRADRWGYQARVIREQSEAGPGINICNYDRLGKLDPAAFGVVSLDEASILKSFTGKTTRALIAAFRGCRFKMAATATPAPNDHMELGNHAEFLEIMAANEMLSRFFINDTSTASQEWRLKGHAERPFWDWLASWSRMAMMPSDLGDDDAQFTLPPMNVHKHRARDSALDRELADMFGAQWLRNLIAARHIPAGDVDERSITDVKPDDIRNYTQAHFFAGIGGWPHALRLAGWPDDRPVWTGSCPCQPFSAAGKRRGTADERHLWPEFRRLIAERRPAIVFGEQVASKDGRLWLSGIRADLEAMGYAVGAADLCAAGVGVPHIRQRLWWVADAGRERGPRRRDIRDVEQAPFDDKGASEKRKWVWNTPGNGGTDGGLADADGGIAGDRGLQPGGQHGQQPQDGGPRGLEHAQGDGRIERRPEPSGRGVAGGRGAGGLAHPDQGQRGRLADGEGRERDGAQAGRQQGDGKSQSGGAPRGMGDADGTGYAIRTRLAGNDAAQIGEAAGQTPEQTGSGFWSRHDLIPCADGKARRVPAQSGFLLLANGVWYRMADVRAEYGAQAMREIVSHAQNAGTGPEEVLSLVRETAGPETVQRAFAGSWGVSSPEILFAFLRDQFSAHDGAAVRSRSTEAGTQADIRAVRDLRGCIEAHCTSLRRESKEQFGGEPTNALLALSQFLARCGEAGGYQSSGPDAAAFPLIGGNIPARVGKLRAAGNAIVPQVGAQFIRAYLECEGLTR